MLQAGKKRISRLKKIKPVAVLTSDIHYELSTLKLADTCMRMAITKANELMVPLIVAGDLHNTKANLRGECVNAMLETFAMHKAVVKYVMIGNHDKINEKSEEHSLNFLRDDCLLINQPVQGPAGIMIPYYHDANELRQYLKTLPKGSTLIMHQGILGSNAGDYFQDKSALNPEDVAGFRVISGHYHTKQTIPLPDGGSWDFIGNPYSLGFGEANDPDKGFRILMSDGSLQFVPTNLRRYEIVEWNLEDESPDCSGSDSILWVKIRGNLEDLNQLSRAKVAKQLMIDRPFRLDLIPNTVEVSTENVDADAAQDMVLDSLIDELPDIEATRKVRLKELWKDLVTKDVP
jgi:DNA repair exonuclease SbcCD nuclease subunit